MDPLHIKPMRRHEAAAFISENFFPLSYHTLGQYVRNGGGPLYRKAGGLALYDRAELCEWAKAKMGPGVVTHAERVARRTATQP
jgi:hypothetical protein